MSLRKNIKMKLAWDKANAAAKSGGGSGNSGGYRFNIGPGETVVVKFVPPNDGSEPFIYQRHYVVNKSYFPCAADKAADGKHDGCVFCFEAKKQGKDGNVGLPQRVFGFSVFDTRKYHKLDNKVTIDDPARPGKTKETQFVPCKDDPTCKWCRKGNEAKYNGMRQWSLSGKAMTQLQTFANEILGKKCGGCGRGLIKVKGYECPKCGEPMSPDDPTEEQRCMECSHEQGKKAVVMVMPKEIVSCSKNCDNPRRVELDEAFIAVTRTGAKTDTTYNFTLGDFDDELPDDLKPIDFSKVSDAQPTSAQEQAITLGVRNPFKGQTSRKSDDDDDDDVISDDTDDDSDDDDENDAPIFGRGKSR